VGGFRFARRGGRRDVGLDHHIGPPADHHQVFRIVAPDQDQSPVRIDNGGLDHSKVPLAATRGRAADVLGAEPADRPRNWKGHCQPDQEADCNPRREWHVRTE
jgi:hypothetical protein